MSNMSYCRFRNTLQDLKDCKYAMEEMYSGECKEVLYPEELAAARFLLDLCLEISREFDIEELAEINKEIEEA